MTEGTGKQGLFEHPLAAAGGVCMLAGGVLFVILLLVDLAAGADNPYAALVTFVFAPATVGFGLALCLLSVGARIRQAHRRGQAIAFNLSIDARAPHHLRRVLVVSIATGLLVLAGAYSGFRAYEATDSVAFCGKTCHTVMEPQYVTYRNSPHARVACVQCHIGPGASFYVKSKVSGARQLVRTALNTYARPIQTPVHNLRPAQQTCEGCHWPRQFYGEKLVTKTYYRRDETNSPWTVKLLVKIGGGNPRTGKLEGIHWHMLAAKRVEYIATDTKRQTIPWVRVTDNDGTVSVYRDPDLPEPDLSSPATEIRQFDCMDCHNRPSHGFMPPATALNLALSSHVLAPGLPSIRKVGLELLNAPYATREEATASIATALREYYRKNHPQTVASRSADIDQAVTALQTIFQENFFPEMKTDYRVRENNLSHFVNNGCFRCHDGRKVNEKGEQIGRECTKCHLIIAQGPSENAADLEQQITGLEFRHPEDIGEMWKECKCTECHTPDSGY